VVFLFRQVASHKLYVQGIHFYNLEMCNKQPDMNTAEEMGRKRRLSILRNAWEY
jgi:hypothetical protein